MASVHSRNRRKLAPEARTRQPIGRCGTAARGAGGGAPAFRRPGLEAAPSGRRAPGSGAAAQAAGAMRR